MSTTGLDISGNPTTALVHTLNPSNTLPTLSSSTTLADFQTSSSTVNRWGYTTDNNGSNAELGQIPAGTYQPLSTDYTLIKKTSASSLSSSTTITFGAKVNALAAAGNYVNTVAFSAVANPSSTTLADGMPMQSSNISTACANTPVWDPNDASTQVTYTLKDARDNKEYAVRKLNMGNGTAKCWMVQNLAYAQTNTTLSPDTSDVASGSTYKTPNSITTTKFTTGSNPQYSGDNNNQMHYDNNTAAYQAGNTASKGAYYSWYVATAGTGTNTSNTGDRASASICPKGWRLPYSDGTSTVTNEFYGIYSVYGTGANNSAKRTSFNNVYPLTLAGYYDSSGLSDSGTGGGWWSSVAVSTQRARTMYAGSSSVFPANDSNKYNGFSVRCVLGS